MQKNKAKKIIITIAIMMGVAFLTMLMALTGYHLTSRYRNTITDAVESVTDKFYALENDFYNQAQLPENVS